MVPSLPRTTSRITPYSRPATLAKLDGRTREARLMRDVRAELVAHVGGLRSAAQRMLIEQIVQLRLRIATMDRRFVQAGAMTDHDSRTYLAWSAHLVRAMRALGLKGEAERGPSLADYLAQRAAQPGAEAPPVPTGSKRRQPRSKRASGRENAESTHAEAEAA